MIFLKNGCPSAGEYIWVGIVFPVMFTRSMLVVEQRENSSWICLLKVAEFGTQRTGSGTQTLVYDPFLCQWTSLSLILSSEHRRISLNLWDELKGLICGKCWVGLLLRLGKWLLQLSVLHNKLLHSLVALNTKFLFLMVFWWARNSGRTWMGSLSTPCCGTWDHTLGCTQLVAGIGWKVWEGLL